ncbi:MAG: glycosyltransferase [Betaproteobacteria bacterium]
MRLTVVVTVHDGERFLDDAVRSVFKQTRPPDEIVAVDDGSTDRSASLLAAYPQIRVLSQSNRGCAIARNRGIAEASGDIVALLDQDDVWDARKLELQMAAFAADPALGFAVCAIRNFLSPGLTQLPGWVDARTLGVDQRGYGTGTLVVRVAAFGRVGPFDAAKVPLDDSDWIVRAIDAGLPYVHVDRAIVHRRIHVHNLSGTVGVEARRHALMAHILHASLVRRRAGGESA